MLSPKGAEPSAASSLTALPAPLLSPWRPSTLPPPQQRVPGPIAPVTSTSPRFDLQASGETEADSESPPARAASSARGLGPATPPAVPP